MKDSWKQSTVIEPDPGFKELCNDPSHNPPNMIVIPRGHRMVHTCPSCGQKSIFYPTCVTL